MVRCCSTDNTNHDRAATEEGIFYEVKGRYDEADEAKWTAAQSSVR